MGVIVCSRPNNSWVRKTMVRLRKNMPKNIPPFGGKIGWMVEMVLV